MITNITIKNFILIDSLSLDLKNGLSIFTGETGAGKSIIIDALGFALGDRTSPKVIKLGAQNGCVSVEFDSVPEKVATILSELDIASDQLIIRRVISTDGKSKCWINDITVSQNTIKLIRNNLVQINSQHQQADLLIESEHIKILDRFIGKQDIFIEVSQNYKTFENLKSELKALNEQKDKLEQEQSYLEFVITELETLAPRPNEEDELLEARSIAVSRNKIAELLNDISNELGNADIDGTISRIQKIMLRNQKLVNDLGLTTISDKLDEMYSILSVINDEIYSKTNSIEFDQSELEAIDIRLMELRNSARKYRVSTTELPNFYQQIKEKVSKFNNIEELINQKEQEVLAAQKAYIISAEKLSSLRQVKAKELEAMILQELSDLKMDKIEFYIDIDANKERITDKGIDKVTFLMRTNKGTNIASISEALSGGELSRFILAATIVIADNTLSTMIFDEIDTGVGGPTAYAVGKKLNLLAKKHQVMVVTHQPQVACFADDHYFISKHSDHHQTYTSLKKLNDQEKIDEIARMMSGDKISPEARNAANQLLKEVEVYA